MRSLSLVIVLGCLCTSGCGSSGGGDTQQPNLTNTGGITGTLLVPGVNSNSRAPLASVNAGEDKAPQPDFVPGEILLRFKPETNETAALAQLLKKYEAVGLTDVGQLYPDGPFRLRTKVFGDPTLTHEDAKTQTKTVLRALGTEPSVAHVELNYLSYRRQVIPNVRPNDTAYVNSLLWGQRLIDLPNAWGVSTGRSDVVVAVLDTGIRSNHPELSPLLVSGADFVSRGDGAGFENFGDGDGYDGDPTDPGPLPVTAFHGTHVAATIAAVSNNGKGLSGVAWGIRIMPVRVLGLFTGTDADIISGMRWAAGLPVNGQGVPPLPAIPAKVINMSLGGEGACSSELQLAVDAVVARGISVVVSAGNSGSNEVHRPASCRGVIAVAAVDANAKRSVYSSFQNYVFIAAPGGDTSEVPFGGIVSAINFSPTTYGFYQGTSMAAPHVAGVIALMHSAAGDANRTLSDTDVKSILQTTSFDLGPAGRDPEYGFGIIQAGAAVRMAKFGSLAGLSAPYPVPYPSPHILISYVVPPFQTFNFSVVNIPDVLGRNFCFDLFQPNQPWLTVSKQEGRPYDIFARFDGSALPNGFHETEISVQATDCSGTVLENFKIPVGLVVGFPEIKQRQDTLVVRAFGIDPASQRMTEMGRTMTNAAAGYRFTLPSLRPGLYYVEAGADVNGSGQFGDGSEEIYGTYPAHGSPSAVRVSAGILTAGVNFSIAPGQFITPLD